MEVEPSSSKTHETTNDARERGESFGDIAPKERSLTLIKNIRVAAGKVHP